MIMEDKRYAVIDANNRAVNFILWDGEAKFNPGDGRSLVLIPEETQYGFGWLWDGEKFVNPNPPEETEQP